jgi:hypothetical protein
MIFNEDDTIEITKASYALNILGLGYAVECLSKMTRLPTEEWNQIITTISNSRFDSMSDEAKEEMINYYQHVEKVENIGDKN